MRNMLARRPLMAAAVILTPLAAALWAAGVWMPLSARDDRVVTTAAATVTITAALCAVSSTRRRRESLFLADVITRQHIAIIRHREQAPTVPFPPAPGMRPLRPVRYGERPAWRPQDPPAPPREYRR